jgi:hypothetical protein
MVSYKTRIINYYLNIIFIFYFASLMTLLKHQEQCFNESRFLTTNMFETYSQICKTLHFIVKTMTSKVSIFE